MLTGGLEIAKAKELWPRAKQWPWGHHMRVNEWIVPIYPEAELRKTELPKPCANVYDFGARQNASSRLRHIKALEHENALLTRMVSEVGSEIVRLRKLLATP